MSEAIMNMAGLDISELTASDAIDFSIYGDLSGADSVTEVTHNGRVCQVYHFNVDSGESRVYMDGTKLVRLSSYDKNGKFLTATDISTITSTVPSDKSAPPTNFKAYKGMTLAARADYTLQETVDSFQETWIISPGILEKLLSSMSRWV